MVTPEKSDTLEFAFPVQITSLLKLSTRTIAKWSDVASDTCLARIGNNVTKSDVGNFSIFWVNSKTDTPLECEYLDVHDSHANPTAIVRSTCEVHEDDILVLLARTDLANVECKITVQCNEYGGINKSVMVGGLIAIQIIASLIVLFVIVVMVLGARHRVKRTKVGTM